MKDDIDIESVLRASLAEHARQAPDADRLAERIIADADRPRPVRDSHGGRWWQGWTLPVVAAGSVAAVVALIVGIVQWNHPGEHVAAQPASPTSSLFRKQAPPSLSTSSGPGSSPANTATLAPATVVAPVSAFQVTDLTFVHADEGLALGSAQCSKSATSRCTEIMYTSNGGEKWTALRAPDATLASAGSCATSCVEKIRFADKNIGYAFGPDALFMTTDGGQQWTTEKGGATSLEVANGTAMRVTGGTLQIADVGKSSWKPAPLPAGAAVKGDVVRALSRAYVPAATGGFYASTNDGATWLQRPNPCDTAIASITAAADGSLVVICTPVKGAPPTLKTSTNGGDSYATWDGAPDSDVSQPIAATDASTLFAVGSGVLYRSVNLGKYWDPVATDRTLGPAAFIGFENKTVGRWVSGDGSVIWTTTDAGANWTARSFG